MSFFKCLEAGAKVEVEYLLAIKGLFHDWLGKVKANRPKR
jgi:hypothetical protein